MPRLKASTVFDDLTKVIEQAQAIIDQTDIPSDLLVQSDDLVKAIRALLVEKLKED